ncbi:hypothetical protein ASPZODRAFT_134004 [Penicilliopsis zonata CBS 506.65]|uniref:RING-type domain-containing protein n=1 Tax=Penicilliopsis zonata CBS 506.65 TaxID=1073090 RepID=A0A1L9SDV4_9EURO|nr:hypothetical protein ASPZODRAFT_134004 [Penicilliopsis zonata CBS 506.65]OJJ45359.1 hypothetical protein ASPZODRAFT_134004 [Penicilliopsis zonata CBS 506.65]
MSNRQQIDSVIDDDDEFCPLCIEEFDLSDKNFKPCPCGYQICQFCYNNIKTHSEEGRCPNCRRVYDESAIQYKVPDADEFKADLALKHRKAAAAKKKEAEKREIEASSRKNLAGVRVVQKNLVYVIGLNPTIRDESQLLQTLRGKEYFGQYGDIEKIVVSKAKPGGNPNQGIGVYVTFLRKTDAATCIGAVDGSVNGDRVLRAQYGTTKYCSSFLRNEQCNNRNCTFLHETGEDSDSYSRQDLSSMNTLSSQRPNHQSGLPGGPPHGVPHSRPSPAQAISSPMRRQASRDDFANTRQPGVDGPALPSSASWANKDAVIGRTRRSSLSGSQASQSPRPLPATMASGSDDTRRIEKQHAAAQEASRQQTPLPVDSPSPSPKSPPRVPQSPLEPESMLLDNLLKAVNSPDFRFIFSSAGLSAEEISIIENHPSFIDPYGGVKRRAMREKAEEERLKREQEILQSAAVEEESRESGSLQLGGEPDDSHPPRGRTSRESHGAIQPPSQQGTASNSAIGSPVSASSHQFQGLNLAGRSLTPLQQQQLLLLKSASTQQAGLVDPVQTNLGSSALDQTAQVRQSLLQSQMAQYNALQAQNRQSSRFAFTADSSGKGIPNARMLGQQISSMQSGTPNPLAAPAPQHGLTNGFYTSGVQGPPPGLKTAGTPPISGGGMFAQGHGFTSNANISLGKQEANPELMRELLRGRTGNNVGVLQGQEATKLDEEFPPLGSQPKDKRLADAFGFPLRPHLTTDSLGSARAGTPTLPPGLPVPHSHSTAALFDDSLDLSAPSSPAVGLSRLGTPAQRVHGDISRQATPDVQALPDVGSVSNRVKNASEISLGSPVAKSAVKARDQYKTDLTPGPDKKEALSAKSKETADRKSSSSAPKVKPIKLTLPLTGAQPQEGTPSKSEAAPHSVPVPASAVNSRPNTPLTGISRVSESSLPRQPRVLRVVDTPKPGTPPPMSATPSTAALPIIKARSRRPSISSISRPDTPGDLGSEGEPFTSASASRADSPPPSKIGSAPVRAITKSQAKKERRQKAKEAEAKKQDTVPQSEEPVQAPILGRKRKAKKASAEPSSSTTETIVDEPKPSKPVSTRVEKVAQNNEAAGKPAPRDRSPKDTKPVAPSPVEEKEPVETKKKPSSGEAWRSRNTLEQLIKDSESNGVSIKDLFSERTASLQSLLSQLHKSGILDLNLHPLFSPPNLAQRVDMKCGADDQEDLEEPIALTEEHRKALLRGEPVRINAASTFLKDRCLISPRGCVLRHLTAEEEDRYLALEKSIVQVFDPFQEYPVDPISEPDTTNRAGGLDALFATPENFNVYWMDEPASDIGSLAPDAALSAPGSSISSVPSAPPNVLSAMEADSNRSHNWAIANTAELVNATAASVRSFAAATAKHMLGAASVGVGSGMVPDIVEMIAMTDEELRAFAAKSQKELELSRKDLDVIDKKLAALVKRNKKLAQQALTAAVEG